MTGRSQVEKINVHQCARFIVPGEWSAPSRNVHLPSVTQQNQSSHDALLHERFCEKQGCLYTCDLEMFGYSGQMACFPVLKVPLGCKETSGEVPGVSAFWLAQILSGGLCQALHSWVLGCALKSSRRWRILVYFVICVLVLLAQISFMSIIDKRINMR